MGVKFLTLLLSFLNNNAMLNFDYTTFYVVLGSSIIGCLSGIISIYIVFRDRSLLGDVIAHAALPGIVLAFLILQSKEILWLLTGAIISSLFSLWFIHKIIQYKKIKLDTAFAVILSVFFGLGVLLINYAQKVERLDTAGIEIFLFGQASSLIRSDIILISILSILIVTVVCLFWKELRFLSFDPEYMAILKFPVRKINMLLDMLIIISIVIGLKTVGVVLMAAMVIAPAAAARQWTSSYLLLTFLAGLFGASAGGLGALLSSFWVQTPTGPTIIIVLTAIVFFSLFFAPRKGLLEKWFQHRNRKNQLLAKVLLQNIYALSLQHKNSFHAHSENVIQSMNHNRPIKSELYLANNLGWIADSGNKQWRLTPKGVKVAKKIST